MKPILLTINHAYLFFGTTLYVGVLWALHFFWYPTWDTMTLDVVQDHFIVPTSEATDFFTIVVPLMFIASIVMIVQEWKKPLLWAGIVSLACISAATYVGQVLIIPINETIAAGGVEDQATLSAMLKDWMYYNDVRWHIMNVMWAALMIYFVVKGEFLEAVDET